VGPDETGPTDCVTEQWSVQTDSYVWSSPAVVDGTVYIGGDADAL